MSNEPRYAIGELQEWHAGKSYAQLLDDANRLVAHLNANETTKDGAILAALAWMRTALALAKRNGTP